MIGWVGRSHLWRIGIVLAIAPLLVGLLGVKRPAGLGDVRDVRTWSYPDYTRVVVELSRPVETEVIRLAANRSAGRPERLYLDLPDIWVGRDYVKGIPIGDGLLEDVRLGQNTLRQTRMVIDLQRYARHRMLILRSPDRVVIDVYGTRDGNESTSWPERERSTPSSRLSMPLRSIQTVIVDPGHGGKDPGAIGVGGIREKDVNLKLARLLGKRLEREGFRVVYTRDTDRTLSLEERTVIAEASRGDLFVSVHANASRRKKTRGIEIYYLDKNHERHSLNVAARENGVPRSEVDSLQRTLAKLRVSEASRHSGRLARAVHDELAPQLSKKYRGMTDHGVKKGPFYVLFLSSMPSILLETGFLTNKQDAKLLRSNRYLEMVAERVALGLVRYREDGARLAFMENR